MARARLFCAIQFIFAIRNFNGPSNNAGFSVACTPTEEQEGNSMHCGSRYFGRLSPQQFNVEQEME